MNSDHLGDAFDHWKGAIIQRLLEAKEPLLEDIAVVPMITKKAWGERTRKVYSGLVCVDKVLRSKKLFQYDKDKGKKEKREDYFKRIYYGGDLFLDPDTGVAISKNTYKDEHVSLAEIEILLDDEHDKRQDRVVMVYQQIRGKPKLHCRVQKIFNYPSKKTLGKPLHLTTYDCGSVAKLFFCKDRGRLKDIQKHLKKILGGDPRNRVQIWPQ
jgi:hypothetical protein